MVKGKLYETVFPPLIELPYKVKIFVKTSTQESLLKLTLICQMQLDKLLWH